ncbi:hypothetical protein LWI28_005138 [Acer negundo]|uniref:Pentatricopeptide repeat-containing protein n=1 Tax=Acer negundo TaxID=4023 RepID=A0AAD5NN08_ACENE|nr:hypothetical protein LWI28_005138 [Acer negundo]
MFSVPPQSRPQVNMYTKCGDFDSGCQLFDEMPEQNVVSWFVVISGFLQRGCPEKALLMFRCMRCEGTTVPNSFTLVSTLRACSLLCETEVTLLLWRIKFTG